MTRKEFARKAGCSQSMVTAILNGDRRPSYDLAKKFEKISGVPWTAWMEPNDVDLSAIIAKIH